MQKTSDILKVHGQEVLKETMKTLIFPLHPVPIYRQDHEKQTKKGVELVSSLSLSCKICLDKLICWCDVWSEDCKGKEKAAKYSASQEWIKLFRD